MSARHPLKVATQGHNLMKVNTAGQAREKAEDHRVKLPKLQLCQSKILKRQDLANLSKNIMDLTG
jgi:hypothetical protein